MLWVFGHFKSFCPSVQGITIDIMAKVIPRAERANTYRCTHTFSVRLAPLWVMEVLSHYHSAQNAPDLNSD